MDVLWHFSVLHTPIWNIVTNNFDLTIVFDITKKNNDPVSIYMDEIPTHITQTGHENMGELTPSYYELYLLLH